MEALVCREWNYHTIFSSSMMAMRANLVHHSQGKRSKGIVAIEGVEVEFGRKRHGGVERVD